MWDSFKCNLEFRFPELDIASSSVVLEERKATQILLKPKELDKHVASCLFLQSCLWSPREQKCPAILLPLKKLRLPLPVATYRVRHHAVFGIVSRVQFSVHKNVPCFTLAVSLLLTDAASTSLHLILAMLCVLYCSYSLSMMMHFIYPFVYYFKSFSKSPASLAPRRLIHHLFKVENIRVNKIWVRRLRVNRPNLCSWRWQCILIIQFSLHWVQPFASKILSVLNFEPHSFLSAWTIADMR